MNCTCKSSKMSQKNTKHNIPDISYHLIFGFLFLEELPLIIQCNKEWKRLVTAPSFLQMFRNYHKLCLKTPKHVISFSKTPFRLVFKEIELMSYKTCLSNIPFVEFGHIETLQFFLNLDHIYHQNIDFHSIFETLGIRLRNLTVQISYYDFKNESSFILFQASLSLLTSLNSLSIFGNSSFMDFSFLSHMKQLNKLSSDFINLEKYRASKLVENLVDNLKLCPELVHLKLNDCLHITKQICERLNHSKLESFGTFENNVLPNLQNECTNLLKKLPCLKSIDFAMQYKAIPLSMSFAEWIHHLELFGFDAFHSITNEEINDMIIHLKHLKSITIGHCKFSKEKMKTLMEGISFQLESFRSNFFSTDQDDDLFDHLSKCKKLKYLILYYCNLKVDHFDLMTKCQNLETIYIEKCGKISKHILSPSMQQALVIPSKIFPKLKLVDIK
jgi:hypothetical protein